MNENMRELKLNESLALDDVAITRVPGGWIYTQYEHQGIKQGNMTSCFVPFSGDIELNDTLLNKSSKLNDMVVTKVPGGLIYTQYEYANSKAGSMTSCFVPLSCE